MADLMKLQNGSDIRGVAIEGVPGEPMNLTPEAAGAIGGAFAYWLGFRVGKNPFDLRICVGNDSRLSAAELKDGLLKGIAMFGAEGYDAGLASTPAMFMSTIMPQFEFDGAIMITASHLPYNRNGFKFFTREGGLDKEDVAEILKLASKYNFVGEFYERREARVMSMYSIHLRKMIEQGLAEVPGCLSGMHIVVDAGNGAGGFFAREVLEPMGADISGSCFLEPDGSFPNHVPNPENGEAMASICKAVLESGADLGLIFDTDVDRMAAVGPDGRPISRNEIIALAAALAAEDHPGGTVVTDSITSDQLHEFLEDRLGMKHLRYKRGYRNVINKAKELRKSGEDAFLAIETSGHAAYSDNFFLDDGAFLAVQIVINAALLKAQGKNINDLIAGMTAPAEAKEIRLLLNCEDTGELGDRILEEVRSYMTEADGFEVIEPNYEGIRAAFSFEDAEGWFLLRKSLHDPVMPLNIESAQAGGTDRILSELFSLLGSFDGVILPE